ncbi:CST complex subunit CTC1 isoform X3 [Nicotiana tomentosiformis]|uniref:CST complex subunit CTC1 isoform X3 n=1 Tax=Nicotiana tomentosiformis TaxID=4098 RepID=UPI000878ED9B|nr:CST complex subunit CTC1 isoform X3 [Nicotiana tomentosiformis]
MEEATVKTLSIAELLHQSRPLTGASSLFSNPSHKIPPPQFSNQPHTPSLPTLFPPKILKSLNYPTVLTGTLFLPHAENSPLKCNCFRFSDGSATVCCDILRFNPSLINKKVQILAWNFIPMKCNGGFLEIIRWAFPDSSSENSSDTFNVLSGCCVDQNVSIKARYFVRGVVESVSPVSVVPCRDGSRAGPENLRGFLVNVLVCGCKLCNPKDLRLDMKNLNDEMSGHCYNKHEIVYFCGSASSWHPVFTRLIRRIVSLSGLKKRLVFVGKKVSHLMYVAADNSLMHIPELPQQCIPVKEIDASGEGELVTYTGTVTGVYTRGMIVELDNELLLLLTDPQLSVPHSVRVGAMVSVKKVHFINPSYSWTKTLILGSCVKTSISVECFSSLETGCYTVTCCQSLLAKFIDSLVFVARLWVLLVVISFRRKFSGILSEKEILGSTSKKGFAQIYATSYLPASAFQIRQHGLFMEFVKHDRCACSRETSSAPLKLVAPIANLINYCEAMWRKLICHQGRDFGIMGTQKEYNSISCGRRPFVLSIKRAIHSEDIGVSLLGILKVSPSSGRMLLVDATGSVDVIIPDLPSSWNFNNMYEVRNFLSIMEDIPMKLDHVDLIQNEPFTCRSIFENAPFVREMNMPLHLYYNMRDVIPVNHHFTICVDSQVDFGKVGRGKFHLLQLMHKFPILQKFQGSQHASSTSSAFAEALILPWDLLIADKSRDTHIDKPLIDQLKEPMKFFNGMENGKLIACKRHKPDQLSREALTSGLNDTENEPSCSSSHSAYMCSFVADKHHNSCCPGKIPCLVTGNCVNYPSLGMLQHTGTKADVGSCCKPQVRKALLEFKSEAFSVYEVLKISGHYLIKHQKEGMLCTDGIGDKIVVNSGTNIWSFSFAYVNSLQSLDVSCLFKQCDSFLSHHRVLPEDYHRFQTPNCVPNNGSNEISSDVNLYISSDITNLFDVNLELLEDCSLGPLVPFGEMTNIYPSDHNLPEGNLTSIHGQIKAVHCSDGKSYAEHLRCESINHDCSSLFLEGTISICVHVLMDHKMVKIFGTAKKVAYPAGFGRGVTASFHRVLALSAQDNFMMISTSFIVINPSSVINDHNEDAYTCQSAALNLDGGSPLCAITASLISDTANCLETQPVEFHCRVVAIYVLVLEYNRKGKYLHTRTEPRPNSYGVDIPLAGFIFDDGSSSCCCWASWEIAAVLLGLHNEVSGESYAKTHKRSKKTRRKQACSSLTIAHLRRIMKRHGRVTVRNQASIFDSSCQDLVCSANPDKAISSSDQDFFQSLILKACCSSLLTVVGSLMSSDAVRWLETHLTELDMLMLPMQNIWVSKVHHMDSLAQAKKILQGLVES